MKTLLKKLLPVERLLEIAMKLGALREPLRLGAEAWVKAQGVRTEASMAISAAIGAAAFFGLVPWDFAIPAISTLLGAACPSGAEKILRILPKVQAASDAVKAEAEKKD